MRKKDRMSIAVVGAILLAFIVLGVGYALLNATLEITGTGGTGGASWNIKFTSIVKNVDLTTEGASEKMDPVYGEQAIKFDVELAHPGAKFVYDIIVENKGTINASFQSVNGVEDINSSQPTQIQYKVDRLDNSTGEVTTGNSDLLVNQTHKFRVTIEWVSTESDSIPEATSKSGTIYLDYVQKTS